MKKFTRKTTIFTLTFALVLISGIASVFLFLPKTENQNLPPFWQSNHDWADSLLKTMNLHQKAAQLILWEIEKPDSAQMLKQIENQQPGGVIFSPDSLPQYLNWRSAMNEKAILPLLFGINNKNASLDFMRDTPGFPSAAQLNSLRYDSLAQRYNALMASQTQMAGFHLNFTPYFSLINPNAPDSLQIARSTSRSLHFVRTFQKNSILAAAHVFGGFADFKTDSVRWRHSFSPYKQLANSRVSCLLISDSALNNGFWQKMQKHKDWHTLNIAKFQIPEKQPLKVLKNYFEQGIDLLLTPNKPEKVKELILKALDEKILSEKQLDQKLRKVLLAKKWAGALDSFLPPQNLKDSLNCTENRLFSRRLTENALILLKNDSMLPLQNLEKRKILIIASGNNYWDAFQDIFKFYAPPKWLFLSAKDFDNERIFRTARPYNTLIFAFAPDSLRDSIFYRQVKKTFARFKSEKDVIALNFGQPAFLKHLQTADALLQMHTTSELENQIAPQILFGGIGARGLLCSAVGENFSYGKGDTTRAVRLKYTIAEEAGLDAQKLNKIDSIAQSGIAKGAYPGCQVFVAKNGKVVYNKAFGYHTYSRQNPVKWNDLYDLASVTKIAATTIAAMKMVDSGKMSLNAPLSNFFKDTHIEYTKIDPDTLIKIDTIHKNDVPKLSDFVKDVDTLNLNDSMFVAFDTAIFKLTPSRNIFKVKVKDLLRHKSGVMPVLPILPYMLYKAKAIPPRSKFKIKGKRLKFVMDSLKRDTQRRKSEAFDRYYTREKTDSSRHQIARNMFLRDCYFDTLWIETKQLGVFRKKSFQYSDVNMILLQQAIDSANEKSIDEYMAQQFYAPLGLQTACFLPRKKFPKHRIVPTESDRMWRNQLVHGYVHDPSAAMLGGVSGNAGLFSNAHDLGILFQTLLSGGKYGGRRYLSPATVRRFAQRQPDVARGLGFDKPTSKAIIAPGAPKTSYGHTGFTGTCVWVDPDNELVYVFVSNRLHPKSDNWRIITYRIRRNIHQAIYDAMQNTEKKKNKSKTKNPV